MELNLLHFYPDLMSLYGSYANLSVLARTLEQMGNTVTITYVEPGDEADIEGADFLFMGAGTEKRQKFALTDFLRHGEDIRKAAEDGTAMLFAGTAMELLGTRITDAEAKTWNGLGLLPFTVKQSAKRTVGDVYGHSDVCQEPVVGFMNKSRLAKWPFSSGSGNSDSGGGGGSTGSGGGGGSTGADGGDISLQFPNWRSGI